MDSSTNKAVTPADPTRPWNHRIHVSLKGHWSVWVSGNWRVTFRFIGADVELVDYQDYH
jgi:proteic killer suppression protein